MPVGIEAINVYGGQAQLDVRTLFEARGLSLERFDNLMMRRKSVCLPCEDPVTYGVNAAKPIIDALNENERNRIELIIVATESGLDFAKSLSTYIHDYLNLNRHCRLFEVKQACYSGTAAFQMAANFIASNASPGAKALVVATDVLRGAIEESMAYAEPAVGAGSVAMLVSAEPDILELDFGANGYHSYEVMDTCRPNVGVEIGNADLSLMSYLDCLEKVYQAYCERVEGVDFQTTFDYLAFHTPFAGMVKGAHRNLIRKYKSVNPQEIQEDFEKRVKPSLRYCVEIGNIFGATLYLALCGLIDTAEFKDPKRVGLYSYGSGCSSEFYSGIINPNAREKLNRMRISDSISNRYPLNMQEYNNLLKLNNEWMFGVKDKRLNYDSFGDIYAKQFKGKNLLVLKDVDHIYHRRYEWS